MRVIIAVLTCLLSATLSPRHAEALDYPTRSVLVIIPFTAGGAPDVLLRLVAQQLSEKWGQGVVVDNASPAEFEKFIADENVKWRRAITQANIKID